MPATLWSAFIFIVSLIPGNELPKEDWLDKIHFDKIVHAVFYFTLLLLMIRIPVRITFRVLVIIALLCAAQGILIEFIQGSSLVSGRSFDILDIAANLSGIFIGILLSVRYHKTN